MTIERKLDEIDLLVYGGTEAGIFTAITAARKGLSTILISETAYLYGFFPSLGAWETHYPGCRAPLSWEFRSRIIDYYRKRYGEESTHFQDCTRLEENNPMITFEPHVAESVLGELLESESQLEVRAPCHLVEVECGEGRIQRIACHQGERRVEFSASVFADCSYTGDLAARAGARYIIGRESRSTYGEPHAGRIFTRWRRGQFPASSLNGKLNVLPTWSTTEPEEGSTGEGDDRIQDYSYRICLSSDPDNRILPSPPRNYDRETYAPLLLSAEEKSKRPLPFHHRWLTQSMEEMMENDHLFHGHALPGQKRSWNATNFTGAGRKYSESSYEERVRIEARHSDHALGLLYFLQNDPTVPATVQKEARQWGLARDEFKSSDNHPPALYVRESRRLSSTYVYREQDCLKETGLERAPIHHDGIAFTEFALDSLPCSPERHKGSLPDGQFFEKDKSLPGSLPWRCLLPEGFSNLITPTTPSVTHCAWGTVRQTACLLHLAEVCGLSTQLAVERGIDISEIPILDLQLHLVQNGTMIAFFNDFDMEQSEPWKESALIFGNQGFFADYDVRPEEPLETGVAEIWVQALQSLISDHPHSAPETAKRIGRIEANGAGDPISGDHFLALAESTETGLLKSPVVLRKQALEVLYHELMEARFESSRAASKAG